MKQKLIRSALLIISLNLFVRETKAQGFWTQVTDTAPDFNGGVMILLTDGRVMAKTFTGGAQDMGNLWDVLTPDIHGSYINGTWSSTAIPPMRDDRLYFSSQVLMDGRVYVAGGEYGTGDYSAEVYDPLTNLWTQCPQQTNRISDANSAILEDGRVLQALVDGNLRLITIYDPITNTYTTGPPCIGRHNESTWVKLPDGSILQVDRASTDSERYIEATNQWVYAGNVPVDLYDQYGDETGAGLLLPDGRAFYIGSPSNTAYFTPSGSINPGIWDAGANIPNGRGAPDAAAAMMVNGKILCAVSPVPVQGDVFQSPTWYYEFDYLTNTFTQINAPDGSISTDQPCYYTGMLDLPDGTVLYADQNSSRYYVYTPDGTPLAAGKPTITGITQVNCNEFILNGTLFNGISEGSCYGDDWQNATNYPIIRLTNGTDVYYARTFNWNSTGVQRGTLPDMTHFTLPAALPAAMYSLVVIANGIASDPITFIPIPILSSSLTPPAVCSGTLFSYTAASSVIGCTFTWTRSAVAGISNAAVTTPQTTDPNEVLINTTSNPITVRYTYALIASGCGNIQQVVVVVNPQPVINFTGTTDICLGDSTTLTASGGMFYIWSTGSATASTTVAPVVSTTYSVTATNLYSCSATDSVLVTVSICDGISENENADKNISVYPNPAKEEATIYFRMKTEGMYFITVTDVLGQTIKNERANAHAGKNIYLLSLDGVATGTYILSVKAEEAELITQIIVR
jgi:hypothetical protein